MTTSSDDILALVARLEAATEGSRELDAEIAAAIRVVPEFDAATYRQDVLFRFEAHDDGKVSVYGEVPGYAEARLHCRAAPAYTASIDAKLSGEDIIESCRLFWFGETPEPPGRPKWRARTAGGQVGNAHTEALARRVAALKATAALRAREAGGV